MSGARDDERSRSIKGTGWLASFFYFFKNIFPFKIFVIIMMHWKLQQKFVLIMSWGALTGLEARRKLWYTIAPGLKPPLEYFWEWGLMLKSSPAATWSLLGHEIWTGLARMLTTYCGKSKALSKIFVPLWERGAGVGCMFSWSPLPIKNQAFRTNPGTLYKW